MSEVDEIQVVVFEVGPQEFALEISQVERILRHQAPAALPKAPIFLEGVLPYGDGVVPVVDLRKRLDLPAPVGEETRVMILELGEQRVAAVVDRVVEVLRLDSTTIVAPPSLVRGLAAKYIVGLIRRADRTIVVLNASKLFSSRERLRLAEAEA